MLGPVRSLHTPEWWANAMAGMNFSQEDLNNAATFNRILWQGTMGEKPYPGVRRAADPKPEPNDVEKLSEEKLSEN